ncbi:MAG: helix-turn-helix transcriptional regulator [Bacteroidetes bacterium]|nr:helix-turn-helix transcriptional regulator [Bacteroidota bacterium]
MPRNTRAPKRVLVSSTLRRDILQLLSERGPSSVADLAADMGRPADALYYHFRLLIKNDLIAKFETRPSSRRDETIYTLIRKQNAKTRADIQSKSPEEASSLLSTTEKEYERGFSLPGTVTQGKNINLLANRRSVWLTDDELKNLKNHLSAVDEILQESRMKRDDGQLYAFTYVLSPLEMRPIRRRTK